MHITRLPIGEQAPADADCLRIEEQPNGSFKLTATALCVAEDSAESASIVGGPLFSTPDDAEEVGLAWAASVGSEHLYISVGTLAQPLKLNEMDLPL